MLRVAIVDDEPLARHALRLMLADERGVECVGEARTGPEAVELLDAHHPDAVFLDVEMPGASGIDVLRRVERIPWIVFTTAFDRYAVKAFDLEAVDFLLKPFGRRRLRQAMVKLRRLAAGTSRVAASSELLRRVFALKGDRVVPLTVESIERFEAADDYVRAHSAGRAHLVTRRMKEMEERLDPERFVRIHRSWIVNLDYVREIERGTEGSLVVRMTDGSRLTVSRRRAAALRRRLIT